MAKGPRKPRAARARAADGADKAVKSAAPTAAVPRADKDRAAAPPAVVGASISAETVEAIAPPAVASPLGGDSDQAPTVSLATDAAFDSEAPATVAPPASVGGDAGEHQQAFPPVVEAANRDDASSGAAEPTPVLEVSNPAVPIATRHNEEGPVPAALHDALAMRYAATMMSMAQINVKAMGALQASSASTLQLVERLMGARSLGEAMRLQTEHARKQYQVLSQQAREFAALARRMVGEAAPTGRSRGSRGDGE